MLQKKKKERGRKKERKEGRKKREERKDQWLQRVHGEGRRDEQVKHKTLLGTKTIVFGAPWVQLWMTVTCWPKFLVFLSISGAVNLYSLYVPCKFGAGNPAGPTLQYFCSAIYRWNVTLTSTRANCWSSASPRTFSLLHMLPWGLT